MDYKELVSKMTLEEKAGMCSGKSFWFTKAVERLGIPSVMLSDGPHGLRKQAKEADHLGVNESITAVCFPAACATASSFDRDLMKHMGEVLGKECQAENISVLLGPAINIKRSPLCGRNFEYISEDPYVAGELSASYIEGVQSQNVGTSIKHFALNNQEHERMAGSSQVDERTMREIYLAGFEKAIKQSKPWTVMCSYNKINGEFASESKYLLNDILRDEWGFDGYVVSDWGAVSDRIAGIRAGLDLEMPGSRGINDKEIIKEVLDGILDEDILNKTVERILKIVFQYVNNRKEKVFGRDKDHQIATDIAKECIVLLKNEDVLPLQKENKKLAFIGEFAEKPRFQGGGSSHINAYKVISALEAAKCYANVTYAKGFCSDRDLVEENLVEEALEVAKDSEYVVIFAGLPDSFESEGYDRTHMRLPDCQNDLIEKISKIQKNVIVVLHNGSPVEIPWVNGVKGIVEAYLGGEGIGRAVVDILFGKSNPCGKLAETFPIRLEDNPSYLNFPGFGKKVEYREGIFVGYRYYDSKKLDVLYPFGHGLSYTTFAYRNLKLSAKDIKDTDTLTVSLDITNTGNLEGKEIVQLYVKDKTGATLRPEKELKNFAKISLTPGETKTVTMTLDKRSFAWYHVEMKDWYAATGDYVISVGKSSREIELEETVHVISTMELPFVVDKDTMIGELLTNKKTEKYTREKVLPLAAGLTSEARSPEWEAMMEAMLGYLPLRSLRSFGQVTNEDVKKIVEEIKQL